MEETGSEVSSAIWTRVICGGGRQQVRAVASGAMCSDAPESRSQRGEEEEWGENLMHYVWNEQ